jgi:hypothetical protein
MMAHQTRVKHIEKIIFILFKSACSMRFNPHRHTAGTMTCPQPASL